MPLWRDVLTALLLSGLTVSPVWAASPASDDPAINAMLEPAWRACQADTDCALLPYECVSTAVRKEFLDKAKDIVYKHNAPPWQVACVVAPPVYSAVCLQSQCHAEPVK